MKDLANYIDAPKWHYCTAPNCHVMIYARSEPYCQHHEGLARWGLLEDNDNE